MLRRRDYHSRHRRHGDGDGGRQPCEPASTRVEARSADLLAVGVVQDDRMSIHLSRLLDNAPVRDVAVTVLLRGVAHPTTAEADGGFTLQTPDLRLPGTAGVEFQVAGGAAHETLKGALQVAAGAGKAGRQEFRPATLVVGAELRGLHRLPVAHIAAPQVGAGVGVPALKSFAWSAPRIGRV